MTWLLGLLQIKTVRSAWILLVGAGLLFVFGLYQIGSTTEYAFKDPKSHFETTFLLFWFLLNGTYMAIAAWALYSEKGRSYLSLQKRTPVKGNRNILWYIKFLFSCYAAAFATVMFLGILSLPFAGHFGLEAMFSPNGGTYLLIAGLIWSPLIFRYLK